MDTRTLLLQIVVICAAARALGWLFAKLHQPRVVGEILAGILLGPSLLGWLAPHASAFLFPKEGMSPLYFLSQIGLVLFMFQVGSELDVQEVREMGRAVVLTSNISVLVPFLAGTGLALFLYPRLSNDSVPASTFAIFLGTAMSITAFPVLARILAERGLLQSRVGSIAIACAAVDDLTAWCLLAFLVIRVHAGLGTPLAFILFGVGIYLLIMLGVIRPWLARIAKANGAAVSAEMLAVVLLFAFFSAWATDRLGVHALFGAFLAGVVLPKGGDWAASLGQKLETLNSVLLLPLFFAFTGLRMSVRLLSGSTLWGYCLLIIVVAVFGKLSGSVISVRSAGVSWREALSIGVLLNTRGLVELVILNVGLDLGVISPLLFSMMVIMALVTTFMATPVLDLIERRA
jgi:Kef-type K+ transport system membrane component KefB